MIFKKDQIWQIEDKMYRVVLADEEMAALCRIWKRKNRNTHTSFAKVDVYSNLECFRTNLP
jgi:hypothetical protein